MEDERGRRCKEAEKSRWRTKKEKFRRAKEENHVRDGGKYKRGRQKRKDPKRFGQNSPS